MVSKQDTGYLGNPLLKKAGTPHQYTPTELKEYVKCSKNPEYFIETYMKIVHVDRGLVPFDMYPFQRKIVKTIHNNRFTIAKLPRQSGKALALDTPINTPSGWTTMGQLSVGDVIYDAQGRETTVTFVTETMLNHPTYDIKFDTGEIIKADMDHLWEVRCSDWSGSSKIMTTKQIDEIHETKRDGGRPLYIDIVDNALDYPKADLPIDPWVLGFWLGDGSSNDARYTAHSTDNVFISEEILRCGHELSEIRKDKRHPETEQRNIKGLFRLLRLSGVLHNKHIPEKYIRSSVDQRIALIQGLMDSDGSVGKDGACEFYQKKKCIVDAFREVLFSLGIKNRLRQRIISDEIYYTVSFSTARYDVFRLPRKLIRQQKTQNHPKLSRHYIDSITKTESVPVRCIQVDNPDHLFLCGKSMIPTHNTTTVCGYFLHYILFNEDVNVAILANKGSLARDILGRLQLAYENLPTFLQQGIKVWNKGDLQLENGSKIVAASTSSSAIRGGTYNMILLDEFAFVPKHIADEFFSSVYPTISSGKTTKIVIVSTPCGMNHFYKLWVDSAAGKNEYMPIEVHWSDVPGRDEEWKKETIRNTSAEQFAQEFESVQHKTRINIDRGNGTESISIGELYDELQKAYQK